MGIPAVHTWNDGDTLYADDLNGAFSTVTTTLNDASVGAIFKDSDAVYTGVLTFTQPPVFQAGIALDDALTVTSGGIDVTGGATIAGATQLNGALAVLNTLGVGGLATLEGGIAMSGNITMSHGDINDVGVVNGAAATFSSGVTAAVFAGSGASLTNVPGSSLTGSVPSSLLSGALPAINGAALTGLNASSLAIGTVDNNRLATNLGNRTFGTITFPDGVGTGIMAVIDDDYVATGPNAAPAFTNCPINGNLTWIRVTHTKSGYAETCYIPMVVVP